MEVARTPTAPSILRRPSSEGNDGPTRTPFTSSSDNPVIPRESSSVSVPAATSSEDGSEVQPLTSASSSRSPAPSTAPSVTFSLTSSVSTSYSSAASCAMMGLGTRAGEEQLKEALRGNERLWTLRNAEQLEKLIADGSGEVLIQPASQTQRVLTYKLAEWYGLTASAAESGSIAVTITRNGEGHSGNGFVHGSIEKNPSTLQLAKLVPRPSSPPYVKVTLMKREPRQSGPNATTSETLNTSRQDEAAEAKSFAEREASYLRARARIFTDSTDDLLNSESASMSDTQSVRSGRSSKSGRRHDTLRQRPSRKEQNDFGDPEFSRHLPLVGSSTGAVYRQSGHRPSGIQMDRPIPTFDHHVGAVPSPSPAPATAPIDRQRLAYSPPIYNSVATSSNNYDPAAYGGAQVHYMQYPEGPLYYQVPLPPPPMMMMPLYAAVPGPQVEQHFLSCTPTPGHQPLQYGSQAAMAGYAAAAPTQMMGIPLAQVPAAARLETYLQTSTGPYPPGPHSISSYRSTGSPVPSTVDFDVQSAFSTDSTAVSVTGDSSKIPSPAPSRHGSGSGSVGRPDDTGARGQNTQGAEKATNQSSPGTRTNQRFALPAKPAWVTSQSTPLSSRSSDSSRSASSKGKTNVANAVPPRVPHPANFGMTPRPGPAIPASISAPPSTSVMPTILRRPLSPTSQARGSNDLRGDNALDLDFARRSDRHRTGKLYDPASGKVVIPQTGKKTSSVGNRTPSMPRPEETKQTVSADVNEVIEAKLQALAIVHNVTIGPPPARKPSAGAGPVLKTNSARP